jgi:hypothetical protein
MTHITTTNTKSHPKYFSLVCIRVANESLIGVVGVAAEQNLGLVAVSLSGGRRRGSIDLRWWG